MKGFLGMLRSFGINIDPEEIERMRTGIPQVIIDVQAAVKNFDERLRAIEGRLASIQDAQREILERTPADVPLEQIQ